MPRIYHQSTYVCAQCGVVFPSSPSRRKKYCSEACYRECREAAMRSSRNDRFWKHVDQSGDCWIWTGALANYRYGILSAWDEQTEQQRMIRATHISWEIHHGPVPDGMEVCHNCPGGDDPRCVNPSHLFLGTHQENMADAAAKERTSLGERHRSARLSADQVLEIRRLAALGTRLQSEIASLFGVSLPTVSEIVHRRTWKHLK